MRAGNLPKEGFDLEKSGFCGGNAVVESCGEDFVHFRPDQRDSEGEWFYWAFRVKGAAGVQKIFTHGRELFRARGCLLGRAAG